MFRLSYKDADVSDGDLLTDTAFRSKKHWGYPDEWMQAWKPELKVDEAYISQNDVVKIYRHNIFIGFLAIKFHSESSAEIDHLWLLPEYINHGFGRYIFGYILNRIAQKGLHKATLVAEPNAKGFYEKMGGTVIGRHASKISGRFLDIYEFTCIPGTQ